MKIPEPEQGPQPEPAAADPRGNPEERASALLNAIDFEIEQAKQELQRPGWSPWAFGAAIAAVGWLLLDYIDSGHYWFPVTPLLTVYMFMLMEALQTAWLVLSRDPEDADSTRYWRTARHLRQRRPDIITTIVLWAAALVVHLALPQVVAAPLWWIALLVLAVLTAVFAFVLIALFTAFPIPVRGIVTPTMQRWYALSAVIVIVVATLLLTEVLRSEQDRAVSSLRGSLLSLALVYLVNGFLSQPGQLALLGDLAELRRSVVLDGVDEAAAVERLRLLVRGADISEVARPAVLACLRAIADAEGEVRRCIEELRAFGDIVTRGSGPLRTAERSMIETVVESQRRRLASAASARTAAVLAYGEMKVRLARVGKLRPAEAHYVAAMDAYILQRDSGIDALEKERLALVRMVGEALSARDAGPGPPTETAAP